MTNVKLKLLDKLKNWNFYNKLLEKYEQEFLAELLTEVLIVLGTLLSTYIVTKILKLLADRLEKTKNRWDDILAKAAKVPAILIILSIGATAFIYNGSYFDKNTAKHVAGFTKEFIVTIAVSWFLISYVSFYENRLINSQRSQGVKIDYGTIDGIAKLIKFLIFLSTLIVILDIAGVNIKGILAAAGIGGVAIGFASKDLLANFFGTSIIYLDKPFTIGDWIKSPDKDVEGIVEEIGWRMTKIRRFDKRPIYVPNALFTTMAIENPSRMTHRRIKAVIGVRYQDVKSLPKIVDEIRKMLIDHPEIDTNQTLIVNFEEFADWSINFLIYTFTYTTHWVKFYEVRQDVMMKISDIITKHKASIAFPTNTIQIEK